MYKRFLKLAFALMALLAVLMCVVSCNSDEHGDNEGIEEKQAPEADYFVGNVFQIYVQNLGEINTGVATGFVLNEDGWFITNSHVMQDAYYANAMFEIPNEEEGDAFRTLEIKAAYNNPNKDFFIGKLEGYNSISSYYKPIKLSTDYEIGDITYSVGYPNGTPYMKVNKGKVISRSTTTAEKVNGVEYVASSSYIMPGSSGGILLNDDCEVIGITTLVDAVNGNFLACYSVSTRNFQNETKKVPYADVFDVADFMHPEQIEYIRFFNTLKNYPGFVRNVSSEDKVVCYTYTDQGENETSSGMSYSHTGEDSFCSNFFVSINRDFYYETGERIIHNLYGYWSPTNGFSDLWYDFEFNHTEGGFRVTSTDINYSENVNLTLINCTYTPYGYRASSEVDIKYAREVFNNEYEFIVSTFDLMKQ